MSKTGIVIRTYNEAELLPRTLDAIMRQTEQQFEIVLVDSGSTDDTVEIARAYNRLHIIQIPQSEFSYGKAINLGIKAVVDTADYAVMLSAHAIPYDEHWLSELIKPMEEDSRIVGVYGKQVPLPEHLSNPVVRVQAIESYPKYYGDKPIKTNESYFFSNANSAIRLNKWITTPFDETLPYSEDWKWAQIMIRDGNWLAYQPTAAVYHSHPDSYIAFFNRRAKEEMANHLSDPVSTPLLSKKQTWKRLKERAKKYFRDAQQTKKLKGYHLDCFCMDTILILAAYWGRKNANR